MYLSGGGEEEEDSGVITRATAVLLLQSPPACVGTCVRDSSCSAVGGAACWLRVCRTSAFAYVVAAAVCRWVYNDIFRLNYG